MDYKGNMEITYSVRATKKAEDDLDNFVYYLLVEKMSLQAANALLQDYEETISELSVVAGSHQLLSASELASKGFRK